MREGNDGGEERWQRQQRANNRGGDNKRQRRRSKRRHNENPKNNVQGNEIVGMVKNLHNNGKKETYKRNKKTKSNGEEEVEISKETYPMAQR